MEQVLQENRERRVLLAVVTAKSLRHDLQPLFPHPPEAAHPDIKRHAEPSGHDGMKNRSLKHGSLRAFSLLRVKIPRKSGRSSFFFTADLMASDTSFSDFTSMNKESYPDRKAWLARILDLHEILPLEASQSEATDRRAGISIKDMGQMASALDADGQRMLAAIREHAKISGSTAERKLENATQAFLEVYPNCKSEVSKAIQSAKEFAGFRALSYRVASEKGSASPDVEQILEKARTDYPNELQEIQTAISNGNVFFHASTRRKMAKPQTGSKSKAKPRVTVNPAAFRPQEAALESNTKAADALHRSDLRARKPSPHWRVVIDESGSDFGPRAADAAPDKKGRFVAVAIPVKKNVLQELPPTWHAVEVKRTNPQEVDKVIQRLLAADVGIFGLDVNSIPTTPGDRWFDGVALLIDWILRLLPVEGPTKIDVLIENRLEFKRGDRGGIFYSVKLLKLCRAG